MLGTATPPSVPCLEQLPLPVFHAGNSYPSQCSMLDSMLSEAAPPSVPCLGQLSLPGLEQLPSQCCMLGTGTPSQCSTPSVPCWEQLPLPVFHARFHALRSCPSQCSVTATPCSALKFVLASAAVGCLFVLQAWNAGRGSCSKHGTLGAAWNTGRG